MIGLATIFVFGLLVTGMLLEKLHDHLRQVEDGDRAATDTTG